MVQSRIPSSDFVSEICQFYVCLRSLIQDTRQSAAKQERPYLYASFFEP